MNFKSIITCVSRSIFITLLVFSGLVRADYPESSVNYVVPFSPGGESDVTARHQQPFFKKIFDEDLVISYKPGAGGAVGWSQLNSMKGDGYSIMGINLPHIVIKPLQKNVGFETQDLVGVYMFHYTPDAIVVKEDSPFKTLDDLVAFAQQQPGKLIFSGSGKGSANHLAQVRFDEMAGVKSTYVSFKGTGKAVAALLGKQVSAQWGFTSVGAKHEGKVRMLAVATEARHPRFPDVPTFKELGYDLISGAYRGIAVPNSAPEHVRQQVSRMIADINSDTEFRQRMENDGMLLLDIDYDEMSAFVAQKSKEYIAAAKQAGVIK
ncbi:tripartite tricarboxylate transporter substrate binding protein [Amphritea sp. 1_MG-2023]|uniref:tripartite tricarboxylate transporter substrate binding protein n=1 Tax=Amphritea sp. 1_MG-2023 TaxID=3062670 RepID=UPI0026E1817E|nr:tripartite tricarboxylate transporter substrate binding protein [Amphritea sp. 1_MG-2023]MDO6565158.1 tripartite tricarboxylate transporter substrate binding protein [Amphritea sp. 1_MG-2023]